MQPPSFFRTTAFRWVSRSCAAFLVCSGLLLGFVYWQTASRLTQQFDPGLVAAATTMARLPPDALARAVTERVAEGAAQAHLAGLFDSRGQVLAGNISHLPSKLAVTGQPVTTSIRHSTPYGGAQAVPVRAVAVSAGPDTLVLAHDLTQVAELREWFLRALALGVLPALLLGLLGGTFVSVLTVRRIQRISDAARRITLGKLDTRLPRDGIGDDLDQISGVVNTMLADLERLMGEVKSSGDAIAHDLRTPLTRLRNKLEHYALRGGDTAPVMEWAVTEIDTMIGLVNALLRIGEIERGRRRASFAAVDAALVAHEAAELFAPLAEDRGLHFETEIAPASLHGDRDLLFELLSNLLDNALKYTPPGGRVVLRLRPQAGGAAFEVEDDGPGIAQDEREAVLKRFYRCDKSRQKMGAGLGFSLVTAIARLHGMRLRLVSGAGDRGLRAIVAPADIIRATGPARTAVPAG